MTPDERLNSLKRLRARVSEWADEQAAALNYKASEVTLAQMRLDQHYVAEELAALDAVIEAAPDLLNALWLAADRLQSAAHTLTNPEHVSACVAAVAVARAAIAKAEGC